MSIVNEALQTADRLVLNSEYDAALDRFFEHVQHRMEREGITYPDALRALGTAISDDVADAFEEWWGEDEG